MSLNIFLVHDKNKFVSNKDKGQKSNEAQMVLWSNIKEDQTILFNLTRIVRGFVVILNQNH